MAEYVVLGILEQQRQLNKYRQQQTAGKWAPQEALQSAEMGIGIMGYGQLGRYVGDKLSAFGFRVYGWNRRAKPGDAGGIYSGQHQLGKFLQQADILVCLLPLTTKTENILNRQTFAQLPANAYLINVARGAHLVDRDLLAALDSGQLSGALLDVFREEPLPSEHPFWFHKKVSITPHIASVTNPVSAAKQIVENYQRLLRDEPLLNLVDVAAGY